MPSVLITGASSGIGAASARLLARRGFQVFGTSRHPERLGPEAPRIRWVPLDVTDDASVDKAVEQVLGSVPRLDALVCNAGSGVFGSIEEVSIELARTQFEINVFGTLRTLRAVVPHMRAARHGRIAVVGSLAGRLPIPFWAHYAASKAALESLTLSLRGELAPHGVAVSLIEPGDLSTEFNDRMEWSDDAESVYGERIRRAERTIRESLPRAPEPELAARVIARALTARRPRVRYPVGPQSRLVPIGRRLLPDWLMLRLVRRHFGV